MNVTGRNLGGRLFGLAVIVSLLFLAIIMAGCNGNGKGLIKVRFIDFAPEDGDYNLNWPGPPRRAYTDADKEYYKATIELDRKAPETFDLHFYVKQDISWWPDKKLGDFTATFKAGEVKSEPRFWLVCTKGGNVKGNLDKDGNAPVVYLQDSGYAFDIQNGDWTYEVTATRYEHKVICK